MNCEDIKLDKTGNHWRYRIQTLSIDHEFLHKGFVVSSIKFTGVKLHKGLLFSELYQYMRLNEITKFIEIFDLIILYRLHS